jgi:TPM domain
MLRFAGRGWCLLLVAVLSILPFACSAAEQTPGHPLTLKQIEDLLNIAVPDSTLHNEIKKRGLAFTPDTTVVATLQAKGAGPLTLADIKALVPAANASKVSAATKTPQSHVEDLANVIDQASREQLERYCADLERRTGAQLEVVTVPSLNGQSIEDYAHSLAEKQAAAHKGKDKGILLVLSIGDHRSRLQVGDDLKAIIPDGFAGETLRSMQTKLRAGLYGEALVHAANAIGARILQR